MRRQQRSLLPCSVNQTKMKYLTWHKEQLTLYVARAVLKPCKRLRTVCWWTRTAQDKQTNSRYYLLASAHWARTWEPKGDTSRKQKQATSELFCPSQTKCERQMRQQRRYWKTWFTTYFWHNRSTLASSTYLLNYFDLSKNIISPPSEHTKPLTNNHQKRREQSSTGWQRRRRAVSSRASSYTSAGATAETTDTCQSDCLASRPHPESCDCRSSEAAISDCTLVEIKRVLLKTGAQPLSG